MATKRSCRSTGDVLDLHNLILDNYVTLTERLQVEKVLPHLIQERVLQIEDKQKIMKSDTSRGMAQALLDNVMVRGICTTAVFVEILRMSGHGDLADMLEEKPNSKVARGEGLYDMTLSQVEELKDRLLELYRQEKNRCRKTLRMDLAFDEMGLIEFSIRPPRSHVRGNGKSFFINSMEDALRFKRLGTFTEFMKEKNDSQVGNTLAADWVSDKKVTSNYQQFFKLQLDRVRKDSTITEVIFDQLLHDSKYKPSFSRKSLWKYMEQNQEGILFVLEGLDRLNPFTSVDILKLIDGKLLPKATVIVTMAEGNGA